MSRVEIQKYSVHRFHDQVAMWDGVGEETVYLSRELALKLSSTLALFAHDIDKVKFTKSNLITRVVEVAEDYIESEQQS